MCCSLAAVLVEISSASGQKVSKQTNKGKT